MVKNLPARGDAGDTVSIPGSGRFPGGRDGNPFLYSCLKIPWTEEPAMAAGKLGQGQGCGAGGPVKPGEQRRCLGVNV